MPDHNADDAATASTAWLEILDRLMVEMIGQQERKLLQLARQIVPGITAEDLRNPHDFIELARDTEVNYEDGILAGLLSAHMAIRAEFARRRSTQDDG